MTRTYKVVPARPGEPGTTYRILSNGKPLRWYYRHESYALSVVRDLEAKAEYRQRQNDLAQRAGVKPRRDAKRARAYRAEFLAGMRGFPVLQLTEREISRMCIQWQAKAAELNLLENIPGVIFGVIPKVRITRRKRGNAAHCGIGGELVFAPAAVTLPTIAHEYAHALTWHTRPAHDWTWAAVYIALVRVAIGDSWADELARQFRTQCGWPGRKLAPGRGL